MSVTLMAPPALEPVSLVQMKQHLRVEHASEDTLISAYITSARLHVEALLAKLLISQNWHLNFDRLPTGKIVYLPLAPLLSLNSVSFYTEQSGPNPIPPVDYAIDLNSVRPRFSLHLERQNLRTFGAYELDVTVGYGPAAEDVPGDIRQALILLVAHWYENREAATPLAREHIPHGVRAILEPHRQVVL
ncbi:MAG: head-tail connector protein [Hyphomicrobiales bacterium]